MRHISGAKLVLIGAMIFSAAIFQAVVLARLGLPGSTPDLLLVVVLVLAMAGGPTVGTIAGFAAGMLVDLIPPASGSIGITAAIFAIAGFAAGHIFLEPGRPELRSVLAVAGICAAVPVALAVIGAVLGTMEVTWAALPLLALTGFVYAAALSLIVLPAVGMLYRGADESRFA